MTLVVNNTETDITLMAIDEWFCERCSFLLKRKLKYDSVKCRFCPELKGSLKTCQDENGKVFWVFPIPFKIFLILFA